ncbi:MAG: peptidylprolyl isomerase [Flavobacteriales bacterium]|nr:peptidylprolyl isomerase [Flavobacteriales bacterium]
MTKHLVGLVALLLIASGCGSSASEGKPPNRWTDERLWPVLQAQEHRDTDALCALLKHEAHEVREAAALAFASVQDTLGVPCLFDALRDEAAEVRATAVFALGFVADSLALERMGELAMNERDPAVQRAYLSASFLAMQRSGRLKDPAAILYYLDRSEAHEQARAADALRRLPDSTLAKLVKELRDRMPPASKDVRQLLVLALGKSGDRGQWPYLERLMVLDPEPGVQVNAMRALGLVVGPVFDTVALAMTAIHPLGYAAWDLLKDRTPLSGSSYLDPIAPELDAGLRIRLLGMAMKHGDAALADSVRAVLDAIVSTTDDAYQRAAAIEARASQVDEAFHNELITQLRSEAPAVVRQAAFQGLVKEARDFMATARFANVESQYAQLGEVVRTAMATGDAGLISAAAELLLEYDAMALRVMLDATTEQQARATLLPIRDLEARLLLDQVSALRDGLPPPAHQPPPFNHPIDRVKLTALKQGQRYRITTSQGTIVIATDVNDCPGSSLAFDSLVTAGYYNGKAFHRMVPNFVLQGGCPRGDGYGGMPWTLRTEIGRKLFTAGSVGLASAGRDTESCQFFITHSATPHLDGRYTRYGEVVEGMDVVWRLQVGDVMEKVERVE